MNGVTISQTIYHTQKSETRMTANVLKQEPNILKVKRNANLIQYKIRANLGGKNFIQSRKNKIVTV